MLDQDLRHIINENLPGICILLFDHTFKYQQALGSELLSSVGLRSDDIVGKCLYDIGFPSDADELSRQYRQTLDGVAQTTEVIYNGRTLSVRLAPIRLPSGHISSGIATVHDITDIVHAREAMRALAITDDLTNIHNRRGFTILTTQQLKVESRGKMGALLFFIDLNEMKEINDNCGHSAGDEALQATANALVSTFRESDIIGRYGGDEFVVFMPDVISSMEPVFRSRLQRAVDDYNSRGQRFNLSLSIGSAYYDPDSPKTLDDLLIEADKNMYTSKRERRRNGFISHDARRKLDM